MLRLKFQREENGTRIGFRQFFLSIKPVVLIVPKPIFFSMKFGYLDYTGVILDFLESETRNKW